MGKGSIGLNTVSQPSSASDDQAQEWNHALSQAQIAPSVSAIPTLLNEPTHPAPTGASQFLSPDKRRFPSLNFNPVLPPVEPGPSLAAPPTPPKYNPMDGFSDGTARFVIATRGAMPVGINIPGVGTLKGYGAALIVNSKKPWKDPILWGALKFDKPPVLSKIHHMDSYVGTFTLGGKYGIKAAEAGWGQGWGPEKFGTKWWPFVNVRAGGTGKPSGDGVDVTGAVIVGHLVRLPGKAQINKYGTGLVASSSADFTAAGAAAGTGAGIPLAAALGSWGGFKVALGSVLEKNDGIYAGVATNIRATTNSGDNKAAIRASGPGGGLNFVPGDFFPIIGHKVKNTLYNLSNTTGIRALEGFGRGIESFTLGSPKNQTVSEIIDTPAFMRNGTAYPDQVRIEAALGQGISKRTIDPMQAVAEAADKAGDGSELQNMNALEVLNYKEDAIQKDERLLVSRGAIHSLMTYEITQDQERLFDVQNAHLLKKDGRYLNSGEIGDLISSLKVSLPNDEYNRRIGVYADFIIDEGLIDTYLGNDDLNLIIQQKLSEQESGKNKNKNQVASGANANLG
jgi:hypothetical protein